MRFFKYEGLGNDFIIIPQKPYLEPQAIHQYCNRHFGIGADGILFVFQENGRWHMKVANADGETVEMCGNGIRCVAQWLLDQGHVVEQIETDAGPKPCKFEHGLWTVDMGLAEINGNQVSTGNPHLVFQKPVTESLIDPNLNTEFVKIQSPREIEVRVFERGVGETLACGTGACAATAWLVHENQLPANEEITVHLKGGSLYVIARQMSDGLHIQMKGPAKYIFEGEV
ncbi:MAG: diaminopimelate epimerase [Deltaproteobacteria bacterium]|nr:diaminopimelate epimerase [Deltaproteobacteria bacterium]